ncbi:MAG: prephenate dehydrogenase [Micropruina sp.]|uniref:prephenate dehydrogenase n=1 Tax=Micropruina sp. TaxID=2737536 RepID=UPI0039E49CF4
MNEPTLTPAVVIGTGLVGASVGAALVEAGVEVHLIDAVSSHARVAASRGCGTTEPVESSAVRLVVVAVPPGSLADVIADALATYAKATVTDVGSVKGTVLADLRQRGIALERYVGSHPMAGSQHVGPLTSRPDLFVDRTWVITPHDTSRAKAVLAVQHLARLCSARIVTMGATHHDEAVAQVSHLPQLISTLTAGRLNEVPDEHLKLAGQGLRDVTRIAESDPKMWTQIIAANSDAVRAELEAISESLTELLDSWGDPSALRRFLTDGRRGVRALPGKHGAAPSDYAQVVVAIPDAPGALARLFADIEAAGVNVEDVRIDHDPEREIGYLAVGVAKKARAAVEEAMTAAGWTLRYTL